MKKTLKKLKPCPFCGSDAKLIFRVPTAYVICKTCGAEIVARDWDEYGESIDKVIEAWNRRAKKRKERANEND